MAEDDAQNAPESPEQYQMQRMRRALQFIKELSHECLENGDAPVGTGAEVAFRHIYRRACEMQRHITDQTQPVDIRRPHQQGFEEPAITINGVPLGIAQAAILRCLVSCNIDGIDYGDDALGKEMRANSRARIREIFVLMTGKMP